MDISFIIPCYNSEKTLPACVSAIAKQQGGYSFEIIIADSSKTPVKNEYFGKLAEKITVIHSDTRLFPGQARNMGLQHSKSDYIALIDSDIILPPDWTTTMMCSRKQLVQDHGPHIIMGGSIENDQTTADVWSDALTLMEFYRVLPTPREEFRNELPAANLFLASATVKKLQLSFSTHRMAEDILFCKQALNNGAKIYFVGSNKVQHRINKRFSQYTYYMGAATCIVRLSHPRLLMKLLFIISMPLGSIYKLLTITIGLIRNNPRHIWFLLRRLPFLCCGLLSLHLGILAYPFTKKRWAN
ncbi:MAG: glycosyltransferase family 2 protein [Desulfobulbaceae bacterium]|nr:glycosyltransferase family 2 protein [Desulfobulbaceae bacterium]